MPWPPLFDGALAAAARRVLAEPGGDPALGGVDEARLEAFLVRVPPVLGVLATLAVFLAARQLGGRPGPGGAARAWGALLAAAVYAALPTAVWYGGVTRVDHHVATALLFALHLALTTWALRAEEPTDATLGSLLAGLVAGLALLVWLPAAVFAGLGGLALLARALSPSPGRARDGVRGGLLYFLAAAVVVAVPASQSPWNQVQPGSLINLTEAVPTALFAAAVPFAVLAVPALGRRGRALRLAVAAAAGAAVVLALPDFVQGVREGFDWASRGNLFMDVVDESQPLFGRGEAPDWDHAAGVLTPLGFLFPLLWLALLPGVRRPERFLLLASGAAFAALTVTQHRFGNAFAVPFACTVGVALAEALARARGAAGRTAAALGGLACALLAGTGVLAVLRVTPEELEDVRAWRAEVVDGLRWMRTGTPEPGPWREPEVAQRYGVLSAWGLGHLIEYHARRPTVTTNFGSFVGEENFQGAARALLRETPEELVRDLHRLDAEYVVVTPRQAGDLKSIARIAGWEGRGYFRGAMKKARRTALFSLALYPPGAAPDHYPGLERVHAARRRETIGGARPAPGEPSGPVISIYRLREPAGAPEPASQSR